ncbi:MAG: hypothetical protein ACLGHN_10380 [Bacteriovoracia bacterium]
MKFLLMGILLFSSVSAFAQSDALRSCLREKNQLRIQLDITVQKLNACEMNGGGNSGELEYLRSENFRLNELNRALQARIDILEGNNPDAEKFFCYSGCTNSYGSIDSRYIESGVGYSKLEAEYHSKQNTQETYSCNYGVKTSKCEPFRTEVKKVFCTAACINSYGSTDDRYSAGVSGRSVVEAEFLAMKAAHKKHSCNYGVKVITCN